MAKKIFNWNEILDFDGLKKAEKLIEDLKEEIKRLSKAAKDDIEIVDKSDTKAVDDLIKKVEELEKANKDLTATEKKLIKAKEALIESQSEEAKQIAILNTQKAEQNKKNKEEAKEALGLIDTYQRKSKQLNELRKRYKNLILQEGKATKETKKLRKEIVKLDTELKDVDASVGQFQRNVGNYADAVEEAGKKLSSFGKGAIAGAAISKITGDFDTSTKASQSLQKGFSDITAAFEVFTASVVNLLPKALNSLNNFFTKAGILNLETKKFFLETFDFLIDDSAKKIAELDSQLEVLNNRLSTDTLSVQDIKDEFADFGDRTQQVSQAIKDLIDIQNKYRISIGQLEKQVVDLTAAEEYQRAIAEDTTLSFKERQEALNKTFELTEKRTQAEVDLANKRLELVGKEVELELTRQGESAKANKILTDQNLAVAAGEELFDRYKEAVLGVRDAQNEQARAAQENAKIQRENTSDLLEQELDVLIDGADFQKTINERIIADQKVNFQERQKIFKETQKLQDATFNAQIKAIQEATGIQLDANELLAISDATLLKEKLVNAGLSEALTKRAFEIVKEQKLATQDLIETERDLNDEYQDRLDIQNEIDQQRLKLAAETKEEFDKIAERDIDTEIENLQRRLDIAKEGSTEFLEIERELNELLLEQKELQFEKEEELRQKNLEKERQAREELIEGIDMVSSAFNEALDDRRQKIEESIAAQEQAVADQQARAIAGQENTAMEERRILADKQKDLAKQEQLEQIMSAVTAFWDAYKAYLSDPNTKPDQALQKAAQDVGGATAITGSIKQLFKGFSDGGYTGDGGKYDAAGIVHKGEFVIDKETTGDLGLRNKSMVDFKKMLTFNDMKPSFFKTNREAVEKANFMGIGAIDTRKELNEIKEAINNKPVQQIDVKGLMIREKRITKGRTTLNHIKIR